MIIFLWWDGRYEFLIMHLVLHGLLSSQFYQINQWSLNCLKLVLRHKAHKYITVTKTNTHTCVYFLYIHNKHLHWVPRLYISVIKYTITWNYTRSQQRHPHHQPKMRLIFELTKSYKLFILIFLLIGLYSRGNSGFL